jgi:CRISPR-associated protein Csb2
VHTTVEYSAEEMLPARPCAVFGLPEGVAFAQEDAVVAAAMLRSLTCRSENRQDFLAEFPNDDPEVYLAGHLRNARGHTPPRFSYLPLPTIGHQHADGMIRRLMIAEPRGGSSERARWAARRLFAQTLRDMNGVERGVLDAPRRRGPNDPVVRRYTARSLAWASVTPVTLPGYDEGLHRKAEGLFLKALEHEGIPVSEVADITLRKAPFWPGAEHPCAYRRPDYLRGHSAWHVHIVLRRPITGPLSIGSGRHCGLGVFAAVEG